jgi:hypothetical protein
MRKSRDDAMTYRGSQSAGTGTPRRTGKQLRTSVTAGRSSFVMCLIQPIGPCMQLKGLATAVAAPRLWTLMVQGPYLGLSRVAIYRSDSRP